MTPQPSDNVDSSNDDGFQIGDETLWAEGAAPASGHTSTDGDADRQNEQFLKEIRIRLGTLLKAETVSFLLGAGVSVDCGGHLIGSVPVELEQALQSRGISGRATLRIRRWLRLFYLAARASSGHEGVPSDRTAIIARRTALSDGTAPPLPVNFEHVLAQLCRWKSAIPTDRNRLRIDGSPPIDVTRGNLDLCLQHATRELARSCDLPAGDRTDGLQAFKTMLRKVLTRPLNLKRVNIFTLNYDTLIEQAADGEGVVLLDGFVGVRRRIFRPESYDHDLYFPAETTEGRVHRLDRVLHLYKLHGSVTWVASEPTIDNPYGVMSRTLQADSESELLIYPTPAKVGETLGMPYSELFRRFTSAVVRPQSVLFVMGYGFGDEHVNAIVRQALAVPSFTLVIVDPNPRSEFVRALGGRRDQRVWISRGQTFGRFAGFVNQLLPDLRDEEILEKVFATHRALSPNNITGSRAR